MTPRDDDSSPLHLTPLPGSDRPSADVVRPAARSLASDAEVEATVVLRRRGGAEPTVGTRVDRADFAAKYGADPADIALVEKTLGGLGLTVLSSDPASRRLRISGTIGTMERVFGARLQAVTSRTAGGSEVEHRNRTGQLMVPAVLDGVVTAVLGLDDRPQARAEFRVAEARAVTTSYTPLELGEIYRFPPGTDGSGQTIAIIELGGGFAQAELDTYFSGLGITGPIVSAVGVDGAENRPGGDPDGADGEVLLDIEVAGALSPGAHLVVYFAPNTDDGFVDAVSEAAHADVTPASISISWGLNEDAWTEQARRTLDEAFIDAAALGITVTAAAGDNGSSDGVDDGRDHADFPASSPHVLACGGTTLRATAQTVTSETVWNNGPGGGATGGGVSAVFPRPPWQTDVGVPAPSTGSGGRGVPDVSAVADPSTGYEILVDGERRIIGGTSAVAPLWAALIARIVQSTGEPLGLAHPLLYDVSSGFRDVVVGDNGSFEARVGWDACTGLGVPDGAALLMSLSDGTTDSGA